MATKAEQLRAAAEREQSAKKRVGTYEPVSKNLAMKSFRAASKKGRAVHGRTKLQADAKALKPKVTPKSFFKTGPHGGEEQTVNNVLSGRGADGPASIRKVSRKSTRGSVPGGEKVSNMGRAVTRRLTSPGARASRGK